MDILMISLLVITVVLALLVILVRKYKFDLNVFAFGINLVYTVFFPIVYSITDVYPDNNSSVYLIAFGVSQLRYTYL